MDARVCLLGRVHDWGLYWKRRGTRDGDQDLVATRVGPQSGLPLRGMPVVPGNLVWSCFPESPSLVEEAAELRGLRGAWES